MTNHPTPQTQAYRSINDVPQQRELRIFVDTGAEAVLLPLYGVMVPFHITTLKSIGVNQDNDHAYVRVSFNFRWVWVLAGLDACVAGHSVWFAGRGREQAAVCSRDSKRSAHTSIQNSQLTKKPFAFIR
jgi:hypothetical protein